MGFFDKLKDEWADKARIRKEEQEMIRKLQVEAEFEKKRVFEDEFRKNIFEIAKGKAKREAAQKSGLQKLRAENRVRNLDKLQKNPTGFLSKLSEYTQRNIAKREERMKNTENLRKALEEEKRSKIGGGFQPIRKSYIG